VEDSLAAAVTKTIIEIDNLTKTYGTGVTLVKALHGISLKIQQGEYVAIMGPSGSGKSTLLHLLGALDQPTGGRYVLDGTAVNDLNDNDLAEIRNEKIGFVFQQFNLLPRTTALDNVVLPLAYSKDGIKGSVKAKAEQALSAVGLTDRGHHKSNELSGGQQQRVAIARALINDPSIILADEPTGNLDTKSGDEIMAIFDGLNREGKTIVLITHERYIAEHTHRIIHLRDGEIESDEETQNGSSTRSRNRSTGEPQ
jgi:putative ABC transport system ATP-binding protein